MRPILFQRDPFHLTFEGPTPHKQSCRSLALGKSCASCALWDLKENSGDFRISKNQVLEEMS